MAQEPDTTTEQSPERAQRSQSANAPRPGEILEQARADGGIQQDSQIQAALNRLLGLSLQNLALEETLEQVIDQMTSLPWCALSKGVIFLADDQRQMLTLMAQRGLPAPLLTACARVAFGECLCGRAAVSGEIEFVRCVDERHENTFAGMHPHGHYCVPILSGSKVLGVMNTYVEEGHERSRKEEDFLRAAAAVIAGSIERKQVEKRQAQLLQKLSKINQELKDFAYIVSHDLKAPLRAIRTIADWLKADYADKLDAEGKEHLTLLTNRVNRMQNLIDGVLQYSRIGRTEQGTVPVDLARVVPEIIENLGAPEHIAIHIESDLPTVDTDPTRITQVFQNLLSNAIKYMDKPQGRIAVACAEQDACWQFRVSDNGPGIEAKDFERIFKLFQTLGPRDDSESTGIGLTVAKKIVELYGGRIWVESELSQGSTFFFTFPKRSATVAAETLQTCAMG
jgi:nitrogen-specific signal transduction histidine kinase